MLLYLFYLYQIDFVIIGVFRELLTIPFFIAQIVFIIIGIKFLLKDKRYPFIFLLSFVLLCICTVLTFGSFFLS